MKSNRSADFIRNMTAVTETEPEPPPVAITGRAADPAPKIQPQQPASTSRAGLKHFGGYLDDATLEKIALLRVRLKKDNSELIRLAIDELYARHNAKRAFGDA
jgi:hypothetical protein